MGESSSRGGGFEVAFKLVGGCGRFQWFCLVICSVQLLMMTWNHMGYIFIGAVPKHWCHIQELEQSTWTQEQRKNISIPTFQSGNSNHPLKYDECHFYNVNYTRILDESGGDFEFAYALVHSNSEASLSTQGCVRWSYDKSIYLSTIVSEFDLVCGRRYLVATIQASYMIGAFLGTLVFGPLNDRVLGRRKSTLLAILFVLIGGFLTSFATSYLMFIMTRLLVAIGTAGCMQATSVWFLEHCDTKSRARMYCISGMCFGVGYALLPVYAYFIREWSNLQLAFSITTLSLLSFYWLFPESPRWLASNGRDTEAVQALERIARINRMPKPSRADLLQVVQHCHANDQAQSGEQCLSKIPLAGEGGGRGEDNGANNDALDDNHVENRRNTKGSSSTTILRKVVSVIRNFASLLKTRELRRISFTMWALFVAVAFVYYGFAFTTNLTTNPYLLVSLGALMEVPASVLPIPFLSKWGRRPTTVACYLLTGLAALSIAIMPSDQESARTILSMIGKLFVASAFTVLYLVVSEVYPTVARSTGQGAGTLMGRVGSIGAPYVADLLTGVYPDLPCIIFGVVSLLAALIALLIPEMKDVDMKDQIYEYKDSSNKEHQNA